MRGEVHDGIYALHGGRQRGGVLNASDDQFESIGEKCVARWKGCHRF